MPRDMKREMARINDVCTRTLESLRRRLFPPEVRMALIVVDPDNTKKAFVVTSTTKDVLIEALQNDLTLEEEADA